MSKTREIIAPKVHGFFYGNDDVLALSLVEIFPIMEKTGCTFTKAAKAYFDIVKNMDDDAASQNSYTQCVHHYIQTYKGSNDLLNDVLQRFTQCAFENFRKLYTLYSYGKYLEMIHCIMSDESNVDFDAEVTEVLAYV